MRNIIIYARKHATTIAFIAGFVTDALTLRRIDFLFENAVLLGYIVLSGGMILLYNTHQVNRFRNQFIEKYHTWIPLVIQFSFGALLSGSTVFYIRSASLATSWPFLLFLGLLIAGNEVFRKRMELLAFQISGFFIVLFSYTIFSLPVAVGKIGSIVFIGSGFISLLGVTLLSIVLKAVAPERWIKGRAMITFSVLGIYALFNLLYFTNIIPPIPISLKEIGVYHEINRTENGKYVGKFEPAGLLSFRATNSTLHLSPNESVFVASAVFAPAKLTESIFHEWAYFDETRRRWTPTDRLPFTVIGGRDLGYRGYSLKKNIFPGTWRVDVTTSRGQLIGRIIFNVVPKIGTATFKTQEF